MATAKSAAVSKLKMPKILPNDTLVTIASGISPNSKNFLIHKKIACQSPVFASAFESKFVEGQTQTYNLDDVQEEVVQLLIQWLYTQTFEPELEVADGLEDLTPAELAAYKSTIHSAVQTWALADRLLLRALQDKVIDWIYSCIREVKVTPGFVFDEVYELTGPGSELRSLFVSFCARYAPPGTYLEMPDKFPMEMLRELAAYFATESYFEDNMEDKETFHVEFMES